MNYNELIKIASQILFCPVCNLHFSENQLIVKGFINGKVVIQTKCDNNHKPINAIFISKITRDDSFDQPEKIKLNQILDFSNQLNKFDGNFEKRFT